MRSGDPWGTPVVPTPAWSRVGDDECLRLAGWSAPALENLQRMDPGALAGRIRVYPTESVVAASGGRSSIAASLLPPTAGRVVVESAAVSFVPRFPFLDATSYTVLVDPELLGGAPALDVGEFEQLTIERPSPLRLPSTHVVAIYPTAPVIPRNQLRLYVHFSAPMAEGEAHRRVSLHRADTGDVVPDAFLPFDPELWDPPRRRLTVLLDPARIKRGLEPHREAGYPLQEGSDVEVVVDAGFPDASGVPLVAWCRQRYRVGPDVRGLVDPERWEIHAPEAATLEPLRIDFDRPLDRALLDRCLRVLDEDGRTTAGRVAVGAGERSWALHPRQPWSHQSHVVRVDAILEDLAGNSVARVFDREIGRAEHAPRHVGSVSLAFTPRAPSTR